MAELPGEILLKVFKFLPPRELFLSAGVCSTWRSVLFEDEEFWRGKVLKDRRPALLHHLGASHEAGLEVELSARDDFLYHGLNVGWRGKRIATSRKLYSTGRGHQCVWEYSNHPNVLLQPPWILITPFMASADRTCALLLVNMNERPFHVTMREHLGQPPPTDQPLSRLDQYQFDRQAPLRHFTNSHTRGRAAESLGGQPSSETVTAFQFPLVAQARDSWDSWASRGSCADVWHFGCRHPFGEVEMDGKIVGMAFEANPNYDVSFSTLPPCGLLLAACTANREVRVWQVNGGVGGKAITLQWDSKTDNDGNADPLLALPESSLTALAIWSTDRMTSRKRSRFSVAVGHVSAGITALQMERYAADSGPLATPKAGREFSVYLHGDLRWRVAAVQRIQMGGPVQQIHISFDREFTQRHPEPTLQPGSDAEQAGSSASSAILDTGWVLGPLDGRGEAHNLPRSDPSSYLAADSHYQMGLVTMHALVRPGLQTARELPTATTTTQGGMHENGKQAVSDALSRLKMGHRKAASLHPPNSDAKQRRLHKDDEATAARPAATAAVAIAEPCSGSTRSKAAAARCTGADIQSALADDSSAGGGARGSMDQVSGSSTAAAQEAASRLSEAGAEPRNEEIGNEAAASSMDGVEDGDSRAECEFREGGVEPDCQAGCRKQAVEPSARSSSIWCFQLWPGGLPPTPADAEGGSGKGGFQLRWFRSVPNASSLSVGEGLTAAASSDGSLLLLECATGRLVRKVPNVEVDHHALNKGKATRLGQPSVAACSAWVGALGGASRGAHLLSLTELAYSQGGHYQYELSATLHSPSKAIEEVRCLCGKAAVLRSQRPVKLAHAGTEDSEEVVRSFYCCASHTNRRSGEGLRSSCSFVEYVD